ncbi:hypothetical protein H0H92_005119 [Tricholoma furcatifolium]|nr:hypothetical protein H0H92_005119 [Tricholoma furcatifolium]
MFLGSGLTDAYPPNSVDGHDANEIFALLPYDLLAIGNHELTNYSVALDVYQNFVPKWKDNIGSKYLTSNVYITPPGQQNPVPIGAQYRKFKTAQGRTVLSFGVLFNFKGDKGTSTTPVATMVGEDWFLNAIKDQTIDLFVIPGHMPVTPGDRYNNWQDVHLAIRKQHPDTPIIYLGGHTHIRDCAVFLNSDNKPDTRSMALESGRYMETVGAKLADAPAPVQFSRKYLDTNTITYEYHTSDVADHAVGITTRDYVSGRLDALADNYNLSYVYGWPKQNYTLNQSPYDSHDTSNLVQFWIQKALPYALKKSTTRTEPFQVVANNNSQRFDIYSGSFTRNDELSASFYTDVFYYVNIPFSDAQAVIQAVGKYNTPGNPYTNPSFIEERDYADRRYRMWLEEMSQLNTPAPNDQEKTLGYVTTDHCLGLTDGDDTPHTALHYYPVPQFIWSTAPNISNPTNMDLVVLDYIWNQSRSISVHDIVKNVTGMALDAQLYSPLPSYQATAIYAKNCWQIGNNANDC